MQAQQNVHKKYKMKNGDVYILLQTALINCALSGNFYRMG